MGWAGAVASCWQAWLTGHKVRCGWALAGWAGFPPFFYTNCFPVYSFTV